jgi:spore coat protein CotH
MRSLALVMLPVLFPAALPSQLEGRWDAPQGRVETQREFFGLSRIWDVKIAVDPDVWAKMFPTRRPRSTQRTKYPYGVGRVRIASHPELEVGLRFKGNSTFWMTAGTLKRSFKIDFDRVKSGQKFLGLKKLNLNNNSLDGTQVREAIAYQAYRDSGVPASRTAFARVFLTIPGKVEGEYLGLYTLVEQVDRGFLQRNLGQKGALVKPTWSVLSYHGDAWNAKYAASYVPKGDSDPSEMQPLVDLAKLNREFGSGWSDAAELSAAAEMKIQSGFATRLQRVMDVDAFLRYIAVTTLIGNMDSPFLFPHNYYLVVPDAAVPDKTGKVQWLPWDLNNSLGGLGIFAGNRLDEQSIMQPTRRPIIARVLEVPKYQKSYRKIVTELIAGPCSSKSMGASIDLADRTTRPAKAEEKKRAKIVTRAGDLGGNSSSRRAARLGLGGSSRIKSLTRFVRAREQSVLDQLAGRSEGVAARRTLLDSVLGGASGRPARRSRREPGKVPDEREQEERLPFPPPPQNFGNVLPKSRLVTKYDANKDGRLDREERDKARAGLADDPAAKRRRRMTQMFSRGGSVEPPEPVAAADRVKPKSVAQYPGRGLYDPAILRTVFLEFESDDWFEELTTFYRTDVEVPATLLADGKTYKGVGIRFRGSSSYLMVGSSLKKSFNVSLDHTVPKQRLEGFKTLNLLNGNQDSSFLREVLFAYVARNYIPAPRVNYVKLVINGVNWGVYQNAEQFNRDFLEGAFGTRGGVRWKVQRNQRGVGALTYRGEDPKSYPAYELRTRRNQKKDAAAWKRLVNFCKLLNETPIEELPAVLPKVLAIDEVLWYCAMENVFLPSDGYMNQGYDYRIYEDRSGRFHLVSHDSNEILQTPIGRGRGARADLRSSPLFNADNRQRPILNRLLAVPQWRARYLAHVRTIATRWMDWKVLGPVCRSVHELIGAEVARDDKKLFSTRTFQRSLETGRGARWSLERLVEERRSVLLGHETLRGPWPGLSDMSQSRSAGGVLVTARVGGEAPAVDVLLHYRKGKKPNYKSAVMLDDGAHGDGAAGDGVFGGLIPKVKSRRAVKFYLEVRAATGTTFLPEDAEARPFAVRE